MVSFNELRSIHEQLSLVHPSLQPYLPDLPVEIQGYWSYIYQNEEPDPSLCGKLEKYFTIAVEICGHSLVISTLFEEHSYDEYFEDISSLKRRRYDEVVAQAEDRLANVLSLRKHAINLLDIVEVYKPEDQALYDYNTALAELYNYLIRPFEDMRELADSKLREAKQGMTNPDLGARRKAEYLDMFQEWQAHRTDALDSIERHHIEYYKKTVALYAGVRKRMLTDKSRFGKNAFEIEASERLHRLVTKLRSQYLWVCVLYIFVYVCLANNQTSL